MLTGMLKLLAGLDQIESCRGSVDCCQQLLVLMGQCADVEQLTADQCFVVYVAGRQQKRNALMHASCAGHGFKP